MAPPFADPRAPRILLVKTSSMGDVIHNFPVVTDICLNFPGAQIDWLVEESFAPLPPMHPGVKQTLTVAVRRWRKSWWRSRHEISAACSHLSARHYDLVLDTQGLLKSALIARCAHAPKYGFDRKSVREPLATLFYDGSFPVARNLHAVERNRQLAAQALGYQLTSPANYGIKPPALTLPWLPPAPYAVLLHATSRDDKLWSEPNWIALGKHLHQCGIGAVLPWGSDLEKLRAERLASAIPGAVCAPRLNLSEGAAMLGGARAAIGVDTGLSHLAAALGIPTIGIYTSTDPGLTGLYAGDCAINLGGIGKSPAVGEVLAALNEAGINV
ncbi:MAG TPA: lipopolysaccharide heptosyltransferase I [Gallionellaceae bacterium]